MLIALLFFLILALFTLVLNEVLSVHRKELHEDVVLLIKILRVDVHHNLLFLSCFDFVTLVSECELGLNIHLFSLGLPQDVPRLGVFQVLYEYLGILSLAGAIEDVRGNFGFSLVVLFVAEIHSHFGFELLLLLDELELVFQLIDVQIGISLSALHLLPFKFLRQFFVLVSLHHLVVLVKVKIDPSFGLVSV